MSARVLLAALAVMIVVVPLVPGRFRSGRIVLDAVVVAVPLVALAALARMRAVGHDRVPGLLIGPPMAAFLAISLAGAFFGVHPAGSVLTWLRYAAYPFIALGAALAARDEADRRLLLRLLAGVVGAVVLIAFAQLIDPSGAAGAFGFSADVSTRVFATFGNPNSLSEFLLVGISAVAALAVMERGAGRVLAAALAVAAAVTLVLTFTRGSWLALAAGVIVASLLVNWRLLVWFAGGAVVAMVAVRGALDRLLSIGSGDASTVSRLALWRLALTMASRRLVMGYGLGNYLPAVKAAVSAEPGLYAGPLDTLSAHNTFLLILAETGVVGLAAFLWLVGAMLYGCVDAGRKVRESAHARWMNAALSIGIVGFAVNGLTDVSFQNPRAAVFLWVLLGLQAAIVVSEGGEMGSRRMLDSAVVRALLPSRDRLTPHPNDITGKDARP